MMKELEMLPHEVTQVGSKMFPSLCSADRPQGSLSPRMVVCVLVVLSLLK